MKRPLFTAHEAKALLLLLPSLLFCALLIFGVVAGGDRGSVVEEVTADEPQAEVIGVETAKSADATVDLHPFDPNTATYEEFRSLGLSASVAASVVKYRERGKRFEIPEDFATCYGVTDSMYAVLKPYIVIGEEYRLKPFENSSTPTAESPQRRRITPAEQAAAFIADHPSIDINVLTANEFVAMGCTVRQADAVVAWRDERGGFRSAAEVEECKYLPLEVFDVIAPALIFDEEEQPVAPQLIELNSADSATLVTVRGIGARSASDIIAYRERLGGYARVEQLAELAVVREKNYEQIITQIFVDSCKISKIDINFAGPKELERHPYVSARALRRIVKQRQLKGGWTRIEEMIDDDILSEDEAERLAPYLRFRLSATE